MAARGVDKSARKRRSYGLEDKERGMMATILAGDSPYVASREIGIPFQTLHDWKHENAERYEHLRAELAPRVADRIAAEAESLAVKIADREARLVEAFTDEAIGSMDAKDLSGALRNLATSKALQVDKISSPLRGRPTVIHAHEDPIEAGERLLKKYGITIDSTATEVPLPEEGGSANARELPASIPAD